MASSVHRRAGLCASLLASAGLLGCDSGSVGGPSGGSSAAGQLASGRAGPSTGAGGVPATGGRTAGAAGSSGAAGRDGSTLLNPAPGSKLFLGANFWNVDWEGSGNYFASGVDWSSTDNPWKPELLADLAPYAVLRFMDWNLINQADNPQAGWDTRKQKNQLQDEPVAFEWQIDLCNRARKDYWVNIPHQADADYVGKLAQLIHDQLDPGLRVYVEWSNEVWNGTFPQRAAAESQGRMLGLSGDDTAASYLVYESVRAFEAFESVFGKGSPRLVRVIAGQAAYVGPCQAHLAALDDAKINPNRTRPDVYAVAPYFKGDSIAALRDDGIPQNAQWIEDSFDCASGADLPLIAYEGGQDSYGAGASQCRQLQHDPAMRALYSEFLDAMQGAKLSGPFMQYTHSGDCWGLKEKTSDTLERSPKYQGVLDWLADQP